MKKLINNLMYAGLFIMALTFTSCQEEFEEVGTNDTEQEPIAANSTTAALIKNTSANDGSFDNIVDGASCIAIEFPYTVEVGGIEITIDSKEDLDSIEDIFDEFDDDLDVLDIIFPITISLGDFTEIVIESKEQLLELVRECREGGEDDDIECIDFIYPITLFTFDANLETTGSVQVNSDKELRRFFNDLNEDDLVSIDFPVTLIKADGTELVVENNAQLANAIETARNECDEDDDNDFNDDDFDEDRFDFCLTECPWQVREVYRDGNDRTEQYLEYLMIFEENGEVTVKDREGNVLNGTWEARFDDEGAKLTLAFDTLVDFNLEWTVYEIGDHRIKLFSGDGNKIIMKQLCEDDNTNCDIESIADFFENCRWRIADSNEDFDFDGVIDFSNRNIHAYLENGVAADEGNWEITDTGFRFNALFDRLEFLLGDWNIVECGDYWVKIENANGRYIVLEKDCDFEVPTPDTLREILSECEWIIKKVKNQGEEIDRLLGYEFKFMAGGVVTLSNGVNTLEGTWEIGLNNEMIPSLMITIGDEPGVSFEWPLRDLGDARLKFEVEGTDYELILQRVCDDNANDGDVAEIRNIMMGGAWNTALFENNSVNATAELEAYDFYFNEMHQVQVDENDNPIITGLWRVIRNHDGKLKFYLNFENDAVFGELTEVWYIAKVTTDRIELVYEDDNGTKVLVFEKMQ